jgi:hypothetical protein
MVDNELIGVGVTPPHTFGEDNLRDWELGKNCWLCGIGSRQTDHHIIPKGRPFYGPKLIGNEVGLCGTCHNLVHRRGVEKGGLTEDNIRAYLERYFAAKRARLKAKEEILKLAAETDVEQELARLERDKKRLETFIWVEKRFRLGLTHSERDKVKSEPPKFLPRGEEEINVPREKTRRLSNRRESYESTLTVAKYILEQNPEKYPDIPYDGTPESLVEFPIPRSSDVLFTNRKINGKYYHGENGREIIQIHKLTENIILDKKYNTERNIALANSVIEEYSLKLSLAPFKHLCGDVKLTANRKKIKEMIDEAIDKYELPEKVPLGKPNTMYILAPADRPCPYPGCSNKIAVRNSKGEPMHSTITAKDGRKITTHPGITNLAPAIENFSKRYTLKHN